MAQATCDDCEKDLPLQRKQPTLRICDSCWAEWEKIHEDNDEFTREKHGPPTREYFIHRRWGDKEK